MSEVWNCACRKLALSPRCNGLQISLSPMAIPVSVGGGGTGRVESFQHALWVDVAADDSLGQFMPCDVERAEARIEAHLGIGQVVMYPPCQRPPVLARRVAISEPWDDDAGRGPECAVFVPDVPDVSCEVPPVAGASVALPVPEVIDSSGSVGRADGNAPEGVLKRFQQVFAEVLPGTDGEFGIRWQVGNSLELADLAVQEVAHVEALGKADPAEILDVAEGAEGV